MIIPGIPDAESTKVLELIQRHPRVRRVVLYGSRALGRHRPELRHLIDHEGLLDHLERVGQMLWTQQGQPSSS